MLFLIAVVAKLGRLVDFGVTENSSSGQRIQSYLFGRMSCTKVYLKKVLMSSKYPVPDLDGSQDVTCMKERLQAGYRALIPQATTLHSVECLVKQACCKCYQIVHSAAVHPAVDDVTMEKLISLAEGQPGHEVEHGGL